ncbi:MAG: lipase maturation factor family protein [Deltaproteobacteria bacterium]|nr:MAG: lipase maturation factor family protein [Deltaproteobacteria bacterium]
MALTVWLFQRGLALVYLIAFASFLVQAPGLVGPRGILPASEFGRPAFLLGHLDGGEVIAVAWVGLAAAALLFVGLCPPLLAAAAWLAYGAVVRGGSLFMGYQWDALLLESGFLAIFLFPRELLRLRPGPPPERVALWLERWLLFRLLFLSGVVKLASGDPAWRDLSALEYHFFTQPLPMWTSWYAHTLPRWLLHAGTAVMFVIELVLPFAIFLGRRGRQVACAGFVLLMMAIAATGNYGFFNLLTCVLCLLLLDDAALLAALPQRLRRPVLLFACGARPRPRRLGPLLRLGGVAAFSVTLVLFLSTLGLWTHPPAWVEAWVRAARSTGAFHTYGLFAVMTKERPEIILEGSVDGITWRPYAFRYKPGDPGRPPPVVGPHMPRLDWQMWFAALRGCRRAGWFVRFMERLLEGSPEVRALLARDPFVDHPPRYLRSRLYEYRFSTPQERAQTGQWWVRRPAGLFCPDVTQVDGRITAVRLPEPPLP